jgi:hypothetical protein
MRKVLNTHRLEKFWFVGDFENLWWLYNSFGLFIVVGAEEMVVFRSQKPWFFRGGGMMGIGALPRREDRIGDGSEDSLEILCSLSWSLSWLFRKMYATLSKMY